MQQKLFHPRYCLAQHINLVETVKRPSEFTGIYKTMVQPQTMNGKHHG